MLATPSDAYGSIEFCNKTTFVEKL